MQQCCRSMQEMVIGESQLCSYKVIWGICHSRTMPWWQVSPAESVTGDPTRCPAAAYFLPRNTLLLSCVDVGEPTVSYCRSNLNLIHFNLTKVPADSAEEGLISAAVATPQLTHGPQKWLRI